MTQFQREIALVVVLLSFFLGYSVYVETARIGVAIRGLEVTAELETQKVKEAAIAETILSYDPYGCAIRGRVK